MFYSSNITEFRGQNILSPSTEAQIKRLCPSILYSPCKKVYKETNLLTISCPSKTKKRIISIRNIRFYSFISTVLNIDLVYCWPPNKTDLQFYLNNACYCVRKVIFKDNFTCSVTSCIDLLQKKIKYLIKKYQKNEKIFFNVEQFL